MQTNSSQPRTAPGMVSQIPEVVLPPKELALLLEQLTTIDEAVSPEELLRQFDEEFTEEVEGS